MPTKETAWLTVKSLAKLLDPASLNSGRLQDIYAARDEDFAAPALLEIEYSCWDMVGARALGGKALPEKQLETVFVEPLWKEKWPRQLVSCEAVAHMHYALGVLVRKVDDEANF